MDPRTVGTLRRWTMGAGLTVVSLAATPSAHARPPAPPPTAVAEARPVAAPPPADLRSWDPSDEAGSASVDPLLVVGLSFVPASAVAIGIGATQLDDELREECGASGCRERLRDPESSFGPALLTMGATAGLFAVATTAVGAGNTSQGEATAPLAVAGTWMLGNGLSTLGMGAVMLGLGNEGDGAAGIIAVAGALTTATGGGLLLASAAADHEGYEPRSVAELSTGIALATTAAAAAPPMALLCATSTESSSGFIGASFALYCLPTVLGTLGVATTGAVLWGRGARPAADGVAFDVGPGGVHLRGRW